MSLERRIYRNPEVRLAAVSSHVASQLKSYFQCDDVCVIPNAVDTVRFSPQVRNKRRSESRRSFSYDEQDFVLLLIGNDWKKKGLDTLLRALSRRSVLLCCCRSLRRAFLGRRVQSSHSGSHGVRASGYC